MVYVEFILTSALTRTVYNIVVDLFRSFVTQDKLSSLVNSYTDASEPTTTDSPSVDTYTESTSFAVKPLPEFGGVTSFFVFSGTTLSVEPDMSSIDNTYASAVSSITDEMSGSALS